MRTEEETDRNEYNSGWNSCQIQTTKREEPAPIDAKEPRRHDKTPLEKNHRKKTRYEHLERIMRTVVLLVRYKAV